jgi:RNA polymerase sigma-70 factor, ECF subfamily
MDKGWREQSENQSSIEEISDLNNVDILVRKHRLSILRYVLSCTGDRDLAETVTQDCFVRAYRSRENFRGECTVRTWLLAIATNLIRDYTRTKRFRFWRDADAAAIQLSEIQDRVATREYSPERRLLIGEKLTRIRRAIETLPIRQRHVVRLRFEQGMRLPEIARCTGLTTSAIKTHLYRGIRTIRTQAQDIQ